MELVAGSVTSTTWLTGLKAVIAADPGIPPEAALLAELVGNLLTDTDTRPNPHIGWLDLERNGYAVVTARADTLEATTYSLDPALVLKKPGALAKPLEELFEPKRFRVVAGSRELEQRLGSEWKRWDRDAMSWV